MKNNQFNSTEGSDLQYEQALSVVRTTRRASLTFLQRQLNIGYQEAARLIDQLEERSIIGPANDKGPRDILIEDS